MFNETYVKETGKPIYKKVEEPFKDHNRAILTRLVEEYIYKKGKFKKAYSEEYAVPVFGIAPYGQVFFARQKDIQKYLNSLEREVGEFWMTRIVQKIGKDMSETEEIARRVVASWK